MGKFVPYKTKKDINWDLWQNDDGSLSYEQARDAVSMDIRSALWQIRGELRNLNALLNCQRFIAIPNTLNRIAENTAKKKKVNR